MTERTDFELLHGNDDDFTELYDRYSRGIKAFLFLYKLVRNLSDTEDILQLVWLRVHLKKDLYDPEWAFSTWLSRVALRVAFNFYRYETPLPTNNSGLENFIDELEWRDPLVVEEIQEEVRVAVSKLPENSRLGIEAVYLDRTHMTRDEEHITGWKRGVRLLRTSLRKLNDEIRTA